MIVSFLKVKFERLRPLGDKSKGSGVSLIIALPLRHGCEDFTLQPSHRYTFFLRIDGQHPTVPTSKGNACPSFDHTACPSIPKLSAARQLGEIGCLVAQEGRHAAPFHLFDAHTRHRHRAGAPIPRHRHHILESITLMTDVRCKTHASPMRQVQQKHLMAGRVAGRFYQPHGAVREQIKIAIDLKDVELANILKVVLAIGRTSPSVWPERVANLVTLYNMHR